MRHTSRRHDARADDVPILIVTARAERPTAYSAWSSAPTLHREAFVAARAPAGAWFDGVVGLRGVSYQRAMSYRFLL